MPTLLRIKGYRFFFFTREGNEPAHIHVDQAERYAKFWLTPLQLTESKGFRSGELGELKKLIEQNKEYFLEKWDEYHSRKS